MQDKMTLEITDIQKFKTRVSRLIHNIEKLNITEEEWSLLLLKKADLKKISTNLFIDDLSKIRGQNFEALLEVIAREPLRRKVKIPPTAPEAAEECRFFKRRKTGGHNPLVMEDKEDNRDISDKMLKEGVRLKPLTDASPDKNYPNAKLKKTPNCTKVRPVFENKNGILYKALTPLGSKNEQGRVEISQVPKFDIERAETVFFCATKNKMKARHGVRRVQSQNQLAKMPCSKVFALHGCKVELRMKGSDYHWSHLIAFFLGGDQDLSNIIPATAASNYYVLELIEKYIALKLINNITEINVVAEPICGSDSLIPNLVKYSLNWKENDQDCHEVIYINPQSHQKLTGAMLKAIGLLRESEQQSTPKL